MAAKKAKTKSKATIKRTPVNKEGQASAAVAPPVHVPRVKAPELYRAKNVNAVVNKINVDFKRTMVTYADQLVSMNHIRRPSGIMQLDIDCGGGLMAGKFHTLTGPNQSGKTTLLYKYCAMHQKLYGAESRIAFAAIEEGGVDYFRARRMGWKVAVPSHIIEAEQYRRANTGLDLLSPMEIADLQTGIGENVAIGIGTEEEILDTITTLLRTNYFGIIWLDSVEALMPSAEAELGTLEDNPQQAAHARIFTRFMQHYGPISNSQDSPHVTTLIATCQVRANRKKAEVQSHLQKYIPDTMGTNVNAIKHWRQIDMELSSGEKLKDKSKAHAGEDAYGKVMKWKITKGRGDTHDNITGEVEYHYNYPTHTKDLDDLLLAAMKYGVVRETDGMLTLIKSNGYPDDYLHEVPNSVTFVHELEKDFELEHHVRRQVLNAAGKRCVYR